MKNFGTFLRISILMARTVALKTRYESGTIDSFLSISIANKKPFESGG